MPLDRDDERILALVGCRPYTLDELCKELSLPSDDCFRRVRRMESMGVLERLQQCINIEENVVRAQSLYRVTDMDSALPHN